MQFVIKLDCNLKNKTEYYHHHAALLVATKLYHNYVSVKDNILGTGPELFAEQWLKGAFSESDIFRFFLIQERILQTASKAQAAFLLQDFG